MRKFSHTHTQTPCQELWNGFRAKDWGGIPIGNTVDIRLDILIGDNRHEFLETVTIDVAIKTMPLQVLNVSIEREDFFKDFLLDLISVWSNIFNELKCSLVTLTKAVICGFQCVLWFLRHGFCTVKEIPWSKAVCFGRERERERDGFGCAEIKGWSGYI